MNHSSTATEARDEFQKKQARIVKQWKAFSRTEAYQDLMEYIDAQRAMLLKYAEERQMPHPKAGEGLMPLDNETVVACLQNSRGLNIVKVYIEGRTSDGVAQAK